MSPHPNPRVSESTSLPTNYTKKKHYFEVYYNVRWRYYEVRYYEVRQIILLQRATSVITKCEQVLQTAMILLQSARIVTINVQQNTREQSFSSLFLDI